MKSLDQKIVTLFLLNKLREARRQKRWAYKNNMQEKSPEVWYHYLGCEFQAHNTYYAFLENIHKEFKVPAFKTRNGLKVAKNLFGI